MAAPTRAPWWSNAAMLAITTMKLGLTLGDDGSRIEEFSATSMSAVNTTSGSTCGKLAPKRKNAANAAAPAHPHSTSYHQPGRTTILGRMRTAFPFYSRKKEEVEKTHRHVRVTF